MELQDKHYEAAKQAVVNLFKKDFKGRRGGRESSDLEVISDYKKDLKAEMLLLLDRALEIGMATEQSTYNDGLSSIIHHALRKAEKRSAKDWG
ncbi:MAG: hypothetical protein R8K20_11855 [Gallionellaceae bacterium]